MKIAYISITALSDCDLPLIKEMSKRHEVDYYLTATQTTRQGTVININLKKEGGIFVGTQYPELRSIEEWIDLQHVFIINKPVWHDWEWLSFKVAWKWLKMLRRKKYDIIHVTWPLRYCSFPLYLLRSKMILTMHDPIPHSSNLTLENKFHRWCSLKLTPNFILLNRTQKEEFIETYHIDPSRVYISRLGVYSHLRFTVPAPPLCNHPYILYVGSIMPHKGVEYLCQAMLPILREMPNLHLVIAGKGQFYFDITKYEHNPQFLIINRFITDNELASLITNSIAVVCPYVDATQSGVIMSAFALNKPVIASDVGAISETLKDQRHGFLVPPRDTAALTQAIRKIIPPSVSHNGDEEEVPLAEKMGQAINEDFHTGLNSWKELTTEMCDIYNKTTKTC